MCIRDRSSTESAYPHPVKSANGHERACENRNMGASLFWSPDMPDMLTFNRGQVGMNSCDVIMLLYIESVEMLLIKFISLILPWRQTGTCQSVCDRKDLINCSVVCCSKLAISRIYMLVLFLFVSIVKKG